MGLLKQLGALSLPNYRIKQIRSAWFSPQLRGWEAVSTLPKDLKKQLLEKFAWSSLRLDRLQQSPTALKALFELGDGKKIESVLMINPKGHWTACISSQVGCAMGCDFCATGTMGFIRDLSLDEIVDQARFWRSFLQHDRPGAGQLSNIVMMGMGEPLNNYPAVRDALHCFIGDMEVGKTKITLSTVGVKRGMEEVLKDPNWPDVRIAISLHYANQAKRKEHMPVANQRTIDELKDWCLRYLKQYGNRQHHLTFEYLMLEEKNDQPDDIQSLIRFLKGIDRFKMNLIPWNIVGNLQYNRASRERTEQFQSQLKRHGIVCTIRKSLGIEIDAGCGQLAVKDEGLISLGN